MRQDHDGPLRAAPDATDGRIDPLRGAGRVARFRGQALHDFKRRVQIVFQDPFSSLNPRFTVGRTVGEPLAVHRICPRREVPKRVAELLEMVGLQPEHAHRYPHEFSGGQRQRVGVARALALNPRLIVADEPVSALDVSVQAQIINLMMDLQKRLGVAYLFISHNLPVVRHLAHRTAVMYLGKVVESGPTEEVFARPRHPYTQALLSAAPVPDPTRPRGRILLTGEPPSPRQVPPGCRFHPRCPHTFDQCKQRQPELEAAGRRLRGGLLAAGTCQNRAATVRERRRCKDRLRSLMIAALRRLSSAWSGPSPRYRRWCPASGRA